MTTFNASHVSQSVLLSFEITQRAVGILKSEFFPDNNEFSVRIRRTLHSASVF